MELSLESYRHRFTAHLDVGVFCFDPLPAQDRLLWINTCLEGEDQAQARCFFQSGWYALSPFERLLDLCDLVRDCITKGRITSKTGVVYSVTLLEQLVRKRKLEDALRYFGKLSEEGSTLFNLDGPLWDDCWFFPK